MIMRADGIRYIAGSPYHTTRERVRICKDLVNEWYLETKRGHKVCSHGSICSG